MAKAKYFSSKNLKTTIKYGGGLIMIYRCMSFKGVGEMDFIEDNMNAKQHIDTLRDNLSNYALELRNLIHIISNSITI